MSVTDKQLETLGKWMTRQGYPCRVKIEQSFNSNPKRINYWKVRVYTKKNDTDFSSLSISDKLEQRPDIETIRRVAGQSIVELEQDIEDGVF